MTKVCTKCKIEYPATIEYFSSHGYTKDRLHSWCRECGRKDHERYLSTVTGYLRNVFSDMKKRCNNPENKRYKDYGGRGIKLKFTSDEFVNYVVDILKIDPRGLQIDRINNSGHYEKGNIRFVTAKENCNNRN